MSQYMFYHPADPQCTTSVHAHTGSCYWINKDKLSVAEAQKECARRGGSLAILDSQEADEFITDLVQWPLGFVCGDIICNCSGSN